MLFTFFYLPFLEESESEGEEDQEEEEEEVDNEEEEEEEEDEEDPFDSLSDEAKERYQKMVYKSRLIQQHFQTFFFLNRNNIHFFWSLLSALCLLKFKYLYLE